MSKHGGMWGLVLVFVVSIIGACQPDSSDPHPALRCDDVLGCITIGPDEPIRLASIQALSGGAAPIGQTQDRLVRYAIADRNTTLLGHRIELQSEDSGCTFEGGANAALRVAANPEIVGIIGTACSGAAAGAIPIITQAGLVMISGANTAPALTSSAGLQGDHWQPGYFRAIYNGDESARAAAQFAIEELGVSRAATVNDGDLFSHGFASSFERAFTEWGGTITLSLTINKGDTDLRPALQALADFDPQVIYMPIFQPEADYFMADALPIVGESMIFLGTESLLLDEFIGELDPATVMYFITSAKVTSPESRTLLERYQAEHRTTPHTAFPYAYDAANLLLYAIEKTAIQQDGTLVIGRQALRDTLYAVSAFEGVSGLYSCDTFGDCYQAVFLAVRFDDPAAGLAGVLSNIVASYR